MLKRKESGLTQEELAEKIGYSKNHLSSIERGKYTPATTFIIDICNILGETPDYYLIGNSTETTDKITTLIKTLPTNQQDILVKLLECYIAEITKKSLE